MNLPAGWRIPTGAEEPARFGGLAEVVRNDDVPQSVGDAVDCGWEWLRIRCGYCHRSARIMFAARHREETFGSLARKGPLPPMPGFDAPV